MASLASELVVVVSAAHLLTALLVVVAVVLLLLLLVLLEVALVLQHVVPYIEGCQPRHLQQHGGPPPLAHKTPVQLALAPSAADW